jgi:hypothetical protein
MKCCAVPCCAMLCCIEGLGANEERGFEHLLFCEMCYFDRCACVSIQGGGGDTTAVSGRGSEARVDGRGAASKGQGEAGGWDCEIVIQ